MQFDPRNKIIQLCVQGMDKENSGDPGAALGLFTEAWEQASNDFEKFTAAYYVARLQPAEADKLRWLQVALDYALKINDISVEAALPSIYRSIAQSYEALENADLAAKNRQIADSFTGDPSDRGPFYHGTRAQLGTGDLLVPGGFSNYENGFKMNHIYFSAIADTAGLAAALANGDAEERVYIVEPTGPFEHDPNVTDKKFPGNPTRSYRSKSPLRIIGEVKEWNRQTPEQVKAWKERLARNEGEIIN